MNREVTGPHQLWEFDIKVGYIHGENRYFYVLAFLDVFSRKVVGYHIGLSCKGKDLRCAFEEAFRRERVKMGSLLVVRSDNGPQMTSFMFYQYVNRMELEHEFIPKKTPNKNAHVESFFSILETQLLQVVYFTDYAEAYQETVKYVDWYNNERLHGSIGHLPPVEFVGRHKNGEFQNITISL